MTYDLIIQRKIKEPLLSTITSLVSAASFLLLF